MLCHAFLDYGMKTSQAAGPISKKSDNGQYPVISKSTSVTDGQTDIYIYI